MQHLLRIEEVSNILNVSSDTIRRWNKKGLIKSSRAENNYRIFSLEEIRRMQTKLNGGGAEADNYKILRSKTSSSYSVVDLFSGAGGTSLGLENAGLKHIMLVEWDKNAVLTLCHNRPLWNVIHDDVSKVSFKGVEADVVEGGFPCQAFSYAGKRKGFGDIRGTLFFEFLRAVSEIRPKIAIGENVKGLLQHDDGRTFATMIRSLEEIGYKVSYKVLRSQYLDVPQKRERLILIGIRKDLDLPFLFPKEKDFIITMREALKDVPGSVGYEYPDSKYQIMKLVPPGGYWRDLPVDLQKKYMGRSYYLGGGKTGMARRLAWDEPSLTLTTSPAQKQTERCHPSKTRPLTVREYARIQTFPDEWQFMGSMASQYKQIGNAVPVNLGFHIGMAIRSMLDKKWNEESFLEEKSRSLVKLSFQQSFFESQ